MEKKMNNRCIHNWSESKYTSGFKYTSFFKKCEICNEIIFLVRTSDKYDDVDDYERASQYNWDWLSINEYIDFCEKKRKELEDGKGSN